MIIDKLVCTIEQFQALLKTNREQAIQIFQELKWFIVTLNARDDNQDLINKCTDLYNKLHQLVYDSSASLFNLTFVKLMPFYNAERKYRDGSMEQTAHSMLENILFREGRQRFRETGFYSFFKKTYDIENNNTDNHNFHNSKKIRLE